MGNKMKTKRRSLKFASALVLSFLVLSGCGKKITADQDAASSSRIENPLPHKLRALKLGAAEEFAILAYASISSNQNSSIEGKVGLMPGTRDQIQVDPSEVVGGATEILGSDDETTPINLLSNAKVDMVTAYKEAVLLPPDSDKIIDSSFQGIMSSGIYKVKGDFNIDHDLIIKGSETDVWIFKIPANFKMARGAQIILKDGASPKNIFWQVAGSALLESDSQMYGTIIAQQSVEMKNHSKITGRVFAKNGFITLEQAKIMRP